MTQVFGHIDFRAEKLLIGVLLMDRFSRRGGTGNWQLDARPPVLTTRPQSKLSEK